MALIAGFCFAPQLLEPWHDAVYDDQVLFTRQTQYQKIVLTRGRDDVQRRCARRRRCGGRALAWRRAGMLGGHEARWHSDG